MPGPIPMALGLGTAGLSCPPGCLTNAEMLRLLFFNQTPQSLAAAALQAGHTPRTAAFRDRWSSDTNRGRRTGTQTAEASRDGNTCLEPAWSSFLKVVCSSSELVQSDVPRVRALRSQRDKETQARPQRGRIRPSGLCRDACAPSTADSGGLSLPSNPHLLG